MELESDINEKILKITFIINENYPKLSQHLSELPISVPIDSEPIQKLKNLQIYYDTLLSLFRKHVSEQQLVYVNERSTSGTL